MTLNKDGLEAARNAVGTIPGAALWSAVEKAITAYLAALPDEAAFCPECGWNSAMDGAPTALPEHIADAGNMVPPDGLVERLRERYTPEPVPPCSVCGKPLTVQSAGGGNVTVYGCEAHTPFDAEHYDRSRWKQFRPGDRDVLEAATVIQTLQRERDALQAFKTYTHRRLDEAGIAANPDGEHSKAGCRIGDRMDLLVSRAEAAESQVIRLTEENEALRKEKTEIALTALAADGQAQEAYEKLSVAEARIKVLEEALSPFARVGDIFELRARNRPNSDDDPVTEWEDHRVGSRRLTVGDFRRARLLLKEGGE